MTRRNLLTLLASLPFCGWLRPKVYRDTPTPAPKWAKSEGYTTMTVDWGEPDGDHSVSLVRTRCRDENGMFHSTFQIIRTPKT